MVANNKIKKMTENAVSVNIPGLPNVKLLNSAVLFGANASGKSNLLQAVGFLMQFVSAKIEGRKLDSVEELIPFRLDKFSKDEPTSFDLIFISGGRLYQYEIVLNSKRILRETLYANYTVQTSLIFDRQFDVESEEYDWSYGSKFKRDKIIEEKTGRTIPFITMGAYLNSDLLKEIYEWFLNKLGVVDLSDGDLPFPITVEAMENNPELRNEFISILQDADLGIVDIKILEKPLEELLEAENIPDDIREKLREEFQGKVSSELYFSHKVHNSNELENFPMNFESRGTLKIFSLLGPLNDIYKRGMTVFFDEMCSSLHPLVSRSFIRLFQKYSMENREMQLIFTTHDSTLLDAQLFRSDQIWMVEKDTIGATSMNSLDDFKGRQGEALQRGYLAGRYGGIPYIK